MEIMRRGMLMTQMQCHNCGLVAQLNPPSIFTNEQEMVKAASNVHKSSKIICTDPKFVILYGNVLISNKLELAPVTGPPVINHDGETGKPIQEA